MDHPYNYYKHLCCSNSLMVKEYTDNNFNNFPKEVLNIIGNFYMNYDNIKIKFYNYIKSGCTIWCLGYMFKEPCLFFRYIYKSR